MIFYTNKLNNQTYHAIASNYRRMSCAYRAACVYGVSINLSSRILKLEITQLKEKLNQNSNNIVLL